MESGLEDEGENVIREDGLLNLTIRSNGGDSGLAKSLNGTKTPLTQSQILQKKKREALDAMQEAAHELFNYFSHKHLDALIKLVRFTLEKLRKRIIASQAILAYNEEKNKGKINK